MKGVFYATVLHFWSLIAHLNIRYGCKSFNNSILQV
jgi:hypothetical protein